MRRPPLTTGGTPEADIVRSLTEADSDDAFLDLLATLLAAEEKSGNRIRKIFEVIATERNRDGSLLPAVKERVHESVRTKNYYAQKAWEAIEGLLLQRTEAAYLGQDHSELLEKLSSLDRRRARRPKEARAPTRRSRRNSRRRTSTSREPASCWSCSRRRRRRESSWNCSRRSGKSSPT